MEEEFDEESFGKIEGMEDRFKAQQAMKFEYLLMFQMDAIRRYYNEGQWIQYSNSVDALESLMQYYIEEGSKVAGAYKRTVSNSRKKCEFNKRHPLNGMNRNDRIQVRRWEEICEKKFVDDKYRALMILIGQKEFLPRQAFKGKGGDGND